MTIHPNCHFTIHPNCHLIILDLDDTLLNRHSMSISDEIKKMIGMIKCCDIKLALASLNMHAATLLKNNNLYEKFDSIHYRTWNDITRSDKSPMLKAILKELEVDPINTILFDDNYQHCMEAFLAGIKFVHVNKKTMLTMKDIDNGMKLFSINN